jgi:hypothetical protein
LTKNTPVFKETCSCFNLSFAAKRNYKYIVTEFEIIKKQKKAILLKFYLLIIIGFGIILFGNTFLDHFDDVSIFVLKTVSFFYWFGILFLIAAYSILNKHRREFKNFEIKKKKIEVIYEQYQIEIK